MRPFLKGARPFPPSHQGHTYHMGLVFISLLSHLVLRELLQSPHLPKAQHWFLSAGPHSLD